MSLDFENNNIEKTLEEKFRMIGMAINSKRIEMGITIENLANSIKLNPLYISIIESGDISSINHKIYYYGYIKKIAEFLGLETKKILEFAGYYSDLTKNKKTIKQEESEHDYVTSIHNIHSKAKRPIAEFLTPSRIMFILFIVLIIIIMRLVIVKH